MMKKDICNVKLKVKIMFAYTDIISLLALNW